MEEKAYVVLCTCPDQTLAKLLAEKCIDLKLAACVNILPNLTSIYTWNGKMEKACEVLVLIKTTLTAYEKLEKFIKENHPYDCPEIIGIPIHQGFTGYLQWIKDSVSVSA